MERIIGDYTGSRRGPLLLVIGGAHGNEPAGIAAIAELFEMLEREPLRNPGFVFSGRMVGIRGNLKAIAANKRYLRRDLNRLWRAEHVERILAEPPPVLGPEDEEIRDIHRLVERLIHEYRPDRMVVLDLHTTTAKGGIFSICTDDAESQRIAVGLHAPVVRGMLAGIRGTTMHYFHDGHFGFPVQALAFESGQHQEPLSVHRAIAGITNCLRTLGCVAPDDVESRHDQLLIEYSRGLPKVTDLIYTHPIVAGDGFRMMPGYTNFQQVAEGEHIATDRNGPIRAPRACRILMPLYQAQGEDGFFLVVDAEH